MKLIHNNRNLYSKFGETNLQDSNEFFEVCKAEKACLQIFCYEIKAAAALLKFHWQSS